MFTFETWSCQHPELSISYWEFSFLKGITDLKNIWGHPGQPQKFQFAFNQCSLSKVGDFAWCDSLDKHRQRLMILSWHFTTQMSSLEVRLLHKEGLSSHAGVQRWFDAWQHQIPIIQHHVVLSLIGIIWIFLSCIPWFLARETLILLFSLLQMVPHTINYSDMIRFSELILTLAWDHVSKHV